MGIAAGGCRLSSGRVAGRSVVMAVRAVHVAVRELLRRGRTDVEYLAIEAQPLTGELVVAIEHGLAVGDAGDAPDDLVPVLLCNQMAADGDLGRQLVQRLDAHQLGIVIPESIVGLERDRDAVADLLVAEGFFDPGKDSRVSAMQVGDRLVGFLDQLVVRIEELEGDGDDGVRENVHLALWVVSGITVVTVGTPRLGDDETPRGARRRRRPGNCTSPDPLPRPRGVAILDA